MSKLLALDARERIAALRKSGLSNRAIANELGCGETTVRRYIHEMGIRRQELRPLAHGDYAERRAEICRRYQRGEKTGEIAKTLQCDRKTVYYALNAAGLMMPISRRSAKSKPVSPLALPIIDDSWIKPPTLAQLMSGR
jgi:DNA-binding NarL/FixJ family response regulator